MHARFLACRPALFGALCLLLLPGQSFANIYQWDWVNPNDHSQGVMQSSTLCPGGSGANALPGSNLGSLDLTKAYLLNSDLTNGTLSGSTLTNANLSGSTLASASFAAATLTGADFTGAIIGATLFGYTNLTAAQLYSTSSYQSHDLQGIGLQLNNLTGWNLAGQNLWHGKFANAILVNADLSNATLTNTDFFAADLNGANLTNANLQQAVFAVATLVGANLTGADLRETVQYDGTGANMTNTIRPDGTILGLNINAATPSFTVHNSFFNLPIHVTGGAAIASSGSLQVVFDGPIWRSTMSFDSTSSVALNGNLDLQVASGVNLTTLLGQDLKLFDWTGVTPSGQFAQITSHLPAGYAWNTSALYTTGIVDLTQVAIGPTNGQWATNGGGTWSSSSNWTGGNVPGEPQDTASFGTVLTSGTANVSLDTNANLASIAFSTTGGARYVISSTSSNSLILSNTAGPATITNSGSNAIAVPITIESKLSVSVTPSSALTIAGAIGDSGSHSSLTFSGGGMLILSGTNSYSGGTFVGSGKVVVTNKAALLDGSSLTIGNSAAFAPVVPDASLTGEAVVSASTVPVPEPATMTLLAAAALAFSAVAYRQRKVSRSCGTPHGRPARC
jgi:autotransporter-associated beta strand protein